MLKIGVFGTGHLGKFHIDNWLEIPGVSIVGFYDPNDQAATEVKDKYNLKRYIKPEELLDRCDAVDIVAPTTFHYHLCEMAIRKGKHVFVEKPMTETLEQGRKVVNMVKEAGIKMQVGHVERYNPAFLAIKDMQLKPMFIEVHRLAQFNPRGTEVSVIMDLMIHDIDIILKLVNSAIKSIHASGVAVLTETPDIANVRIEFTNGCVANLTSSRISMKRMRKMRLFQKDAYIGIDFLEKKSEVIQLQSDHNLDDSFSFDITTKEGSKTIVISNPQTQSVNAIREELKAFKQSIEQQATPEVSEIEGYLAMEVAHQIIEKINSNRHSYLI
jgi:predicted dehydrogenase